jgi:hypothetical protein
MKIPLVNIIVVCSVIKKDLNISIKKYVGAFYELLFPFKPMFWIQGYVTAQILDPE